MAFLDNSGDIILDAVLTDLGRKMLAAGNFRIHKFALGDEEIDYSLYNTSDTRGNAFYDLEIMQTPILEAFTSDQSLMKSRLVTLTQNNILYMPILKMNNKYNSCKPDTNLNGFNLIADTVTYSGNNVFNSVAEAGFLHGVPREYASTTTHICIDQGIDSSDNGQSIATRMRPELLETAFDIKVDARLLTIDNFVGGQAKTAPATTVTIDDDGIATYRIQQGVGDSSIIGPYDPSRAFAGERSREDILSADQTRLTAIRDTSEMFAGPLGNVLRIAPRTTPSVQTSTSFFTELGSDGADLLFRGVSAGIDVYKYIDTTISVTGITTGYTLDIPIRIIKGSAFTSP